jgi:hypothetical protein
MWQLADSERVQKDAFGAASGWHPSPFVRSLQLAFHRLCDAWDLAPQEKA